MQAAKSGLQWGGRSTKAMAYGGGRRRASAETPPVAWGRGGRGWDTSRRASSMRTRHEGSGVGFPHKETPNPRAQP